MELIRRIDAGVFPHPEFNAYPDYVDWVTYVRPIVECQRCTRTFIALQFLKPTFFIPGKGRNATQCNRRAQKQFCSI